MAGIPEMESWALLLERRRKQQKADCSFINSGITDRDSGLARIGAKNLQERGGVMRYEPSLIVL